MEHRLQPVREVPRIHFARSGGGRGEARLRRKFKTQRRQLLARNGKAAQEARRSWGCRGRWWRRGWQHQTLTEENRARVSMSPWRRASAICAFIRTKLAHKREVKTMPSFLLLPRARLHESHPLASPRLVSVRPDLATPLAISMSACRPTAVLSFLVPSPSA